MFPAWVRRFPRAAWISVPLFMVCAAPYWADVRENARFMTGFVGGWRNNDSLFGALLWLTGNLQHAKYAAFALLFSVVAWVSFRRWPLPDASLAITTALLVVSANCHPWYLTWLLPLAVLRPRPWLLLWIALAPLGYAAVIEWTWLGVWNGISPLRWYVYLPVLLLGTYEAFWLSRTSHRRYGTTRTSHNSNRDQRTGPDAATPVARRGG